MLNLKTIAVTGSVASGKSLVLHFFQELGAYVISADQIVHELLSKNQDVIQKVISLFGKEIILDDAIDRKKVADIVFDDPQKLHELETIIHPYVFQEIEQTKNQIALHGKYPLFIAEIPLLFETNMEHAFDATVAVFTDEQIACDRFCKKYNATEDEYRKRASLQLTPEEKAKKATFVLHNNGAQQELKKQCKTLFNKLISKDLKP